MTTMFSIDIDSDYQGLLDCLQRKGTPKRVYHMELFADPEAVADRIARLAGLSAPAAMTQEIPVVAQ